MGARQEEGSFRSVQFIFNPWNTGHTTVSVVTVDHRGDRRAVHRIGTVDLPVGRLDLRGLSPLEVTERLAFSLSQWLNDHRSTPDRAQPPAPPDGGHGGESETGAH